MEIIDSESSTPWVGWRCVDCGDRFALPGEPDRYDLPLMEKVEAEDLPTEAREAAALLLALCASTPAISSEAEGAIYGGARRYDAAEHALVSGVATLAGNAWTETFMDAPRGIEKSVRYAEAEALIRNGEV